MVDQKRLQEEINRLSELMTRARQDASQITADLEESGQVVSEIQKKKMESLDVTHSVYRGFYE